MARRRVAIMMFDEVEMLDFASPFEVFSALHLDEATRRGSASPCEVIVAGVQPGLVRCRGGLKVQPACTIADLGAGHCRAHGVPVTRSGCEARWPALRQSRLPRPASHGSVPRADWR